MSNHTFDASLFLYPLEHQVKDVDTPQHWSVVQTVHAILNLQRKRYKIMRQPCIMLQSVRHIDTTLFPSHYKMEGGGVSVQRNQLETFLKVSVRLLELQVEVEKLIA